VRADLLAHCRAGPIRARSTQRRGDVPSPAPGDQFPGVIEAPRGRHSEKAAVFAEHIERLFPNVPKLEMFARRARQAAAVAAQEVAAQSQATQRAVGTNQYSERVYNNESDVHRHKARKGNSNEAAERRLRKDRPDLHTRVLTGELTWNAAMVEAGFRKAEGRRRRVVPVRTVRTDRVGELPTRLMLFLQHAPADEQNAARARRWCGKDHETMTETMLEIPHNAEEQAEYAANELFKKLVVEKGMNLTAALLMAENLMMHCLAVMCPVCRGEHWLMLEAHFPGIRERAEELCRYACEAGKPPPTCLKR
jgi:hypothetical protein